MSNYEMSWTPERRASIAFIASDPGEVTAAKFVLICSYLREVLGEEEKARAEGAAAERARLVAVVRAQLETEPLMSRGALRRLLVTLGEAADGGEGGG